MDPEKIRENMRKLSYAGENLKPKPVRESKPRWEPLPGDDLAEIQKGIRQEELAREIARKADSAKPPAVKRGPRGGQYTEATTKEGRRYRRYF